MTFSRRLRWTLVMAAVLPTALITLIVVIAASQQIKRIEHRDAVAACARFTDLFEDTVSRIYRGLAYIGDTQEFQVMEWSVGAGRTPDPRYSLPLLSLDFVEYIDAEGRVRLSADRPAMVGQQVEVTGDHPGAHRLVYENDLRGPHAAVAVVLPTESGFLRGGIFLDAVFENLASAVTRSTFVFVDTRAQAKPYATADLPGEVGLPYRAEGRLQAVLAFDSAGEFYPVAHFLPSEQQSLFANFFTAVAAVTFFSLLVVIPVGLYFSSRTRRDLKMLTDGAIRVAEGEFTRPVTIAGEGEFADLADSFNHMMRQLTDYRERLIVSQRIAAWQSIGRQVAHEVKNPLTPISVAVDDLRRSFRERQPDFDTILDGCTATVKQEIARLKKLLAQFSSFAEMPPPEPADLSADDFIQDISVLFNEDISAGRLRFENTLGESVIHFDPDQIRQVIINIVKNGLEAGAASCVLRLLRAEGRLTITVEDDGPGFPPDMIAKGIMPYFSTKDHGRGLGLVICQRIVFDHDGTMNLENKPEGGARVTITLPQRHGQDTDRR